MIMKGQKRKFPPEDVDVSDRTSPTWESQRQFVFSVSLSKYQRGQELPEPSLRRSVLIANTLRQISLEACRSPFVDDEVSPCASSSPAPPAKEWDDAFSGVAAAKHHSAVEVTNSASALSSCPLVSTNHVSHCVTSRCPGSCHSNASSVALSVGDDDEEDWGSMSTDPDFSLSAAISSILTALDSTIDGSGCPQAAPPSRTPLRSLENLSRAPEGSAAWAKQGGRGYGGGWEQQQESNMEVMRSSYLSDLTVEDLFQDIDTSLLERDMGVLGLRGSGGGYTAGDDLLRYLPPFSPSSSSLSFNQNLKCLPSFSSFCPLSSSSSSSLTSPSSPFSGQNHVRDGLELEHLMEILVES